MARPIDAGKTGFCMTGQDLFGRYARIAYGHALNGKQDYHIYKCIQRFKSNCYCDTPLTYQTENNCYNHEDVTDVVNVIHCGIDESCVIRVALKDIELLPTISPDEVRGVVHCKDCKWSHAGYCEKYDDLIPWGCANKPWEDWFCADGKRRETIKEAQNAD